MAKESADELVLYKTPAWVYPGYLIAIAGAGLFMWAGAESKWALVGAGVGVLVLGAAIVWMQKMHRRAWARKNQLPE
ncbi:MAG: hypothetical protein HY907_00975 [Deltaproteobacteria bacterium]|nr:hypothetical protein [Deltaproteobacteria bacterium]